MSDTHGDPVQGLQQALAERFAAVQERVWAALARAGRPPDAARIVAVTKKHPPETIQLALAVGMRDLGENYAQEMAAKIDALSPQDQAALRWHFIGRLQRNKVKHVVGRAALIHAVDSESLAREVDLCAGRYAGHWAGLWAAPSAGGPGLVQPVLLAVNLAGEAQKSGVPPAQLAGLLAVIAGLPHVSCAGLMTMPPLARTPEDSRPYFRRLAELRASLATAAMPLPELSMGTTGDFEIAIEEGATLVRVGTAIFGARPT
jgi:pyridoxal phosphate enzyme (YggS family)